MVLMISDIGVLGGGFGTNFDQVFLLLWSPDVTVFSQQRPCKQVYTDALTSIESQNISVSIPH